MRKARRILVAWLASLLAIPLFLVVTSSPAAASAVTCDLGEWCVWSGQFGGAFDQVANANLGHDPDLRNNTYDTDNSRTQHNTISSVWNRTDRWVRLFDGIGYTNEILCIGPGASRNLSLHGQGDRISSYRVGSCVS